MIAKRLFAPHDVERSNTSTEQRDLCTVVIPVFNEVTTVNQIVDRVLDQPFNKEIIVVDDGSTDGTAAGLVRWTRTNNVQLLRHSVNRGKGAAIRSALARAKGWVTVIQDADLEYSPEDLPQVVQPVLDGEARIVFGSRYAQPGSQHPHLVSHYGVGMLNRVVRSVYRTDLSDQATCFKAFRTDVLRRMELECQRFEFCAEVTAKACRMGISIREVSVNYAPRSYSDGKKLTTADGIRCLYSLLRYCRWSEPMHALPWGPTRRQAA